MRAAALALAWLLATAPFGLAFIAFGCAAAFLESLGATGVAAFTTAGAAGGGVFSTATVGLLSVAGLTTFTTTGAGCGVICRSESAEGSTGCPGRAARSFCCWTKGTGAAGGAVREKTGRASTSRAGWATGAREAAGVAMMLACWGAMVAVIPMRGARVSSAEEIES